MHVARGARGNPWIFTGHEPTHGERVAVMREHFELYLHYANPLKAQDERPSTSDEAISAPLDASAPYLSPLRAQLAWYVHGLPSAAALRRALSEARSIADFERIFDEADRLAEGVSR